MKNRLNCSLKTGMLLVVLLHTVTHQALCKQEEPSASGDKNTLVTANITLAEKAPKHQGHNPLLSHARLHARSRRQAFDGFRMSDILKVFNRGALEGVDSVLRSTRNFDVFQCLERLSCEMAAPLRNAVNSPQQTPLGAENGQFDAGSLAALQGAQQQFLNPALQQLGQFSQQGFQQIPQVPQVPQPGFQQFAQQPGLQQFAPQPGFQQFAPQIPQIPQAPQIPQIPQPGFQQFPQFAAQVPQQPQQFAQNLQFTQPTFQQFGVPQIQRRHVSPQNSASNSHQPTASSQHPARYQHLRPTVKKNDGNNHQNTFYNHRPVRHRTQPHYREYRQRYQPQKQKESWFERFVNSVKRFGRKKRDISNVGDEYEHLNRVKRGIMDTLEKLWGGEEMVGVLDRMMQGTDDSLYPYTRAALMGYTGSTKTCEQLYPECPTTMDEFIDTFNNLRSYFPNGVPFRERIPLPFRYLIP